MQCGQRPLESDWASCLPRSEEALRTTPILVEILEAEKKLELYRSVMDAALACFVPEARVALRLHYAGKGELLQNILPSKAIARLDERLSSILMEIGKLQPIYIQLAVSEVSVEIETETVDRKNPKEG